MSRPIQNTSNAAEVNCEQAKKSFLRLAHLLGKNPSYKDIYNFFTKNNLEHMIEQKLQNSLAGQDEKYEVMNINGINKLVEKKKWPTSYAQCLCWEEMFDLFMPLHVECGHRDWHHLSKAIRTIMKNHHIEYKYPWIALPLFQKACTICSLNNKKLRYLKLCSTYVVPMAQKRDDENFKYLFIYFDQQTHYTLLRPLIAKNHLEISTELYRIFTQFGPPNTLFMHGYNSKLTDDVTNTLRQLCPTFKIEIWHKPAKYELPTLVIDRIEEWMLKTRNKCWEVGCFIVQSELNNSYLVKPELKEIDVTPYDLQFHTKVYDTILTEFENRFTNLPEIPNRSKHKTKPKTDTSRNAQNIQIDFTNNTNETVNDSSAVNNVITGTTSVLQSNNPKQILVPSNSFTAINPTQLLSLNKNTTHNSNINNIAKFANISNVIQSEVMTSNGVANQPNPISYPAMTSNGLANQPNPISYPVMTSNGLANQPNPISYPLMTSNVVENQQNPISYSILRVVPQEANTSKNSMDTSKHVKNLAVNEGSKTQGAPTTPIFSFIVNKENKLEIVALDNGAQPSNQVISPILQTAQSQPEIPEFLKTYAQFSKTPNGDLSVKLDQSPNNGGLRLAPGSKIHLIPAQKNQSQTSSINQPQVPITLITNESANTTQTQHNMPNFIQANQNQIVNMGQLVNQIPNHIRNNPNGVRYIFLNNDQFRQNISSSQNQGTQNQTPRFILAPGSIQDPNVHISQNNGNIVITPTTSRGNVQNKEIGR